MSFMSDSMDSRWERIEQRMLARDIVAMDACPIPSMDEPVEEEQEEE